MCINLRNRYLINMYINFQVYKTSADNKIVEKKSTTSEKPRQLYWEKRLTGLSPSYTDETFEPFELPKNFKPIGPGVLDDIALASITTSLHMNSGAIVGQKNAKVNGTMVMLYALFSVHPKVGTIRTMWTMRGLHTFVFTI